MTLTTHTPRQGPSGAVNPAHIIGDLYYSAASAAVTLANAETIDLRGKSRLYVFISENQAGDMSGVLYVHFSLVDTFGSAIGYEQPPSTIHHCVASPADVPTVVSKYTYNLSDTGGLYARIPMSVITNGTVTVWVAVE